MELTLTRIAKRKTYTIGRLAIVERVDDEYLAGEMEEYFCDTLEPTWRDYKNGGRKIVGCSAIPEGRYAVVITWSPKFGKWLPLLQGDEAFKRQWSGIRIHAGNTKDDTAGCILVGQNLKPGMVMNSNIWLHRLKQKIVEAKGRGEAVWLTVK